MNNYRFCLTILSALAVCSYFSTATSAEVRAKTLNTDFLAYFSQAPLERGDRMRLAELLQMFCSEMMSPVPALSPRENDWLDNEIKEGRMVHETVEIVQRAFRLRMQGCINHARSVQEAEDIISENIRWLLLARSIDVDFLGWIRKLQETFPSVGDEHLNSSIIFYVLSDLIIDDIVINGLIEARSRM